MLKTYVVTLRQVLQTRLKLQKHMPNVITRSACSAPRARYDRDWRLVRTVDALSGAALSELVTDESILLDSPCARGRRQRGAPPSRTTERKPSTTDPDYLVRCSASATLGSTAASPTHFKHLGIIRLCSFMSQSPFWTPGGSGALFRARPWLQSCAAARARGGAMMQPGEQSFSQADMVPPARNCC